MTARAFVCGAFLVGAAVSAGAGEKVTMKASPSFAFAPANLNVQAVIEADADNRAVEVAAESADFYRSSQIQLDGENGPHRTDLQFRSLPAGLYVVSVTLFGADGRARARVHQEVNVVPDGGER